MGVDVRAGNAGDGEGAVPLLESVQGTDGVEVATLLGDMAYSDGDVREAVEAAGTELVAKVPPVTNSGRFPKTDFAIDTAAGTVTCPAGVTTTEAKKAKDHKGRAGQEFRFPTATCASCPLREQCVGGAKGRSIFVGRHHDRMAAARAAQTEPATKALLRQRSKIERKIDHLQDLGMRTARYRGRRKTRLQTLLAATVANYMSSGTVRNVHLVGMTGVPFADTSDSYHPGRALLARSPSRLRALGADRGSSSRMGPPRSPRVPEHEQGQPVPRHPGDGAGGIDDLCTGRADARTRRPVYSVTDDGRRWAVAARDRLRGDDALALEFLHRYERVEEARLRSVRIAS